jgi:hypothetical protein
VEGIGNGEGKRSKTRGGSVMKAHVLIDQDSRKVVVRLEPEVPADPLLLKRMEYWTRSWTMNKDYDYLECEFDDGRSFE